MKVLIAGAGMGGSTLWRILRAQGHQVDIYDTKQGHARCGVHPCGFGVSGEFHKVMRSLGLDPDPYITNQQRHVLLEGIKVRADLYAIDKPALLDALCPRGEVAPGRPDREYDMVVDATGFRRALSLYIQNDLVATTYQARVRLPQPALPRFDYSNRIGYMWLIPLSSDSTTVHIGMGAIRAKSQHLVERVTEVIKSLRGTTECVCVSRVRVSGPSPEGLYRDGVWHIGESAGLVSPLGGAGNLPAMRSAQLLLNPGQHYVDDVMREFAHFVKERAMLDRMLAGGLLGLKDARGMKKSLSYLGLYPNWWQLLQLQGRVNTVLRS